MKNALSVLLRRKTESRPAGQAENEVPKPQPPMPTLPAHRPRRLSISPDPADDFATLASPLFQCIPFEIREQILLEAFGDQTVHMDLQLAHPPAERRWRRGFMIKKQRDDPYDAWTHANAHRNRPRDTTLPQRWEWWSSVCHRSRPPMTAKDLPAEDRCRKGRGRCKGWPGEVPHKSFIGVMGWLLACREAYIEGVHVLYSKNCFHVDSSRLTRHLPEVLLHSRLAAITQVELIWKDLEIHPWLGGRRAGDDRPLEEVNNMENYRSLVSSLPEMFPNLRQLYMYLDVPGNTFHDQYRPDMTRHETVFSRTSLVLKPIDDMVRRMGSLRECRIALPASLYAVVMTFATGSHIAGTEEMGEDLPRHVIPDPHRPEQSIPGRDTQKSLSYLLCLGYEDRQYPLCF